MLPVFLAERKNFDFLAGRNPELFASFVNHPKPLEPLSP